MLLDRRLKAILRAHGYQLRLTWPRMDDAVVVWGHGKAAKRGAWVAKRAAVPLYRLEDAFLRSALPGRAGGKALGLLLDELGGVHYEASSPSRLRHILDEALLDDPQLLAQARAGIEELHAKSLSKYNFSSISTGEKAALPQEDYILLIDQLRGDASLCGGGEAAFTKLRLEAEQRFPQARWLIKRHPEALLGLRAGHFEQPLPSGWCFSDEALPLQPLLQGAKAIFVQSSQVGFEAILLGQRPIVGGQPFYAGRGLSEDLHPPSSRLRPLKTEQLFAGAMILAPLWYDPCRDQACTLETVLRQLEAEARAQREDQAGYQAIGMRLWKRAPLRRFFGAKIRFLSRSSPRQHDPNAPPFLLWGDQHLQPDPRQGVLTAPTPPILRLEDGFLRSRGLGADLVAPMSLIRDDLGIYYDPNHPSRLEREISRPLSPQEAQRCAVLVEKIRALGLSKYNLGTKTLPPLPEGRRILVPGQVEDDASLRWGAGEERSNLALLRRARRENPDAIIIYKPHPDVEAGLRKGHVPRDELSTLADCIVDHTDPITLIEQVDEVWTMTSLLGFEALLRDKAVTCLGSPFYAGWGLTRDLGPPLARRRAVSKAQLFHAALIAVPRYFDPQSGLPCPPEVILERLSAATPPKRGMGNRLLAKLQGLLAPWAPFWRRK